MGRSTPTRRALRRPPELPLVYSCSGCSSAAQMANDLALQLDRAGLAEMSCIAGVGGGVEGLVRTARSGRRIVALDGCVLQCARACLARAGVEPDLHMTLSDYGVKKRKHSDFDVAEARCVLVERVEPRIAAMMAGERSAGAARGGSRASADDAREP
jgi:uncharacterized metal-binding protein